MNNAEQACLRARALLAKQQLREATAAIRPLLDEQPGYADGWLVLSQIQAAAGNFQRALMAAERALAITPDNSAVILQYCQCAQAVGSAGERVRSMAERLVQMDIDNAYQLNDLGRLLSALQEHEAAEAQYLRATAINDGEPGFYYNLATAQRFLGKFRQAERSLENVLALNPGDTEAYLLLSGLRRQKPECNHIAAMEDLLADSRLGVRAQVNLHYALAKELEDLQRWEESFDQLRAGAQLRRRHMRYDLRGDLAVMQSLQRHFDRDFFAACDKGVESSEPIFILGMPRTGTTLLERALASHSQVQSAGELNDFALQMLAAVRGDMEAGGAQASKLQLIEASRRLDFRALGERYIASTRPLTGKLPHFIDKLPFNYLYIGLIHAALPNAKIIHMVRDPMDTCYAVYKQLFESAYPFSYDLEELGQYYLAYRRLMDHWQKVLPGRIYEVRYEALVRDTEGTVRGLLDHCGLEWQDQCLDFHKAADASTTASAVQVRQPVYGFSVGKWKNYRAQLQPLADILRAGGIEPD